MNMKKLISISLVTLVTALGAFAQDQFVRQFHTDRQMVVGVANANGGQPTGAIIAPATTATNKAVSTPVVGAGTPLGTGLDWPVYGSMLVNTSPTNAYLLVTTTGTGNQPGWSIKQVQGSPDGGVTWINSQVVSNGLPVTTNTISTNIPLPVVNFAGYTKMRVFTIQNTTTNAGPAGSTNSITELDQLLEYH